MKQFLTRINFELDQLLTEEEIKLVKKPKCFLSEKQVNLHFEHYTGYVKGLKDAKSRLQTADFNNVSEYRSILLDYSFNYNAVKLHELYFQNLGKSEPAEKLLKLINNNFKSIENLNEHLKTAMSASRGWVILGQHSDKLLINIIDDHDIHAMFLNPILVLDAWEHAYYVDFNNDKEAYINKLLDDINWETLDDRII